MKQLTVLSFMLIFGSFSVFSQDYILGSVDTIFDCSGSLYDSGGESGNYGPNENITMVICPDGSTGTHIRLTFDGGLDIATPDALCFYDGTNTAAPLLSCHYDFQGSALFAVQATAGNPSGCLTVEFISDGTGELAGWLADISCHPSCQTIQPNIVSSLPAVNPADTGWIDICPGDRVFFTGEGIYPQNNLVYNQSDLTSTFEWDFGDGTQGYGPNSSHYFNEPGGYTVQLTITDVVGCTNTYFLNQRVRVAPEPSLIPGGGYPTEICVGDTISLNGSVNDTLLSAEISVIPNPGSFQVGGAQSDSLALPDGTGVAYESGISLSGFSPGQTLNDIDDLLGICVIMEHSWMRDLEISLSCPDGTTVILHDHPGQVGGEVFLGVPFEGDEGIPPIPGTGFEYCWTPDATNGTWIEYANAFVPNTLPAGDYNSFDPLDDFVGCPLNGTWTISVEDLWGIDNGFIFSWSILFNSDIYPDVEVFNPQIIDYGWLPTNSIVYYSQDSISASPQNPGIASYIFQAENEFGCVYDTMFQVDVLPFTHPNCFSCPDVDPMLPDTIVCPGDTAQLNVSSLLDLTSPSITFESNPYEPVGFTNYPPNDPFLSVMNINNVNPGIITDVNSQICGVCVNMESDFDADIVLELIAPGGQVLLLSSNNGGSGDDYLNTCFTPTAGIPITAGSPPFTGNFQPEGNWAVLNGVAINGDWTLRVSDAFGINDIGELTSWSICFNTSNDATYSWSPNTYLSCDDCPDPSVIPDTTTTYIVTASDIYNCTATDTFTVFAQNTSQNIVIDCSTDTSGGLTFNWSPIVGVTDYQVSINGGAFGSSNGGASHLVTGLVPGDTVSIDIQATSSLAMCFSADGSETCVYTLPCFLSTTTDSISDISCTGQNDGSIAVIAAGGYGLTLFSLDGQAGQSTGTFSGLAPGNHFVLIGDDNGCQDSIPFLINEPDSLVVQAVILDSLACAGDMDGIISPLVSGGTAPYVFNWQGNNGYQSNDSIISLLGTDQYCVEVEDINGCQAQACITLPEPPVLSITNLVGQDPSCFDAQDGNLLVQYVGGLAPLTFTYAEGSPTNILVISPDDSLSNVGSGLYFVALSDANGCLDTASVSLTNPLPLLIDSFEISEPACAGFSNGQATAFVSGPGVISFQWNDANNQTSMSAGNLDAGTYILVISNGACTESDTIQVGEPAPVVSDIQVDHVNCNGDNDGGIQVQINGGVPPYMYDWNIVTANDTNVTNLFAGDYILQTTDAEGCIRIDTISILQPDSVLQVQAFQSLAGCFGTNSNQATALASGGNGNYTYQWSNLISGPVNLGLSPANYAVTVTDILGCTAETSVSVSDLEPIAFSVDQILPTCAGYADGTMTVVTVSGGVGNNDISQYQINWNTNPLQSGPTAMGLSGEQNYVVVVVDSLGCTAQQNVFLADPPALEVVLTPSDVSCFGDADGSIIATPNSTSPSFSYFWSTNPGVASDSVETDLLPGIYYVTVVNALGCEASSSAVIHQPQTLATEFSVTANLCAGDEEGAISLDISGGTPGYQVTWSNGMSGASILGLPAGPYIAVIEDSRGCLHADTVVVEEPDPLSAILLPQSVSCYGDTDGRIRVLPGGGTAPFTFSIDGQNYTGADLFIGLEPNVFPVYIRDINGCEWNGVTEVLEPLPLQVDAGDDVEIIYGDSVLLDFTYWNNQGGVTFHWRQPYVSTLICPDCPPCDSIYIICASPWAHPENSITYAIEIQDERGCTAVDDIFITVDKLRGVFVPTAFTPNGDNQNDILHVLGREEAEINVFRVFDRWGELVFERGNLDINDPSLGWDGTYLGQELNPGVFVWYLEVTYPDGGVEKHSGQTHLIR